MKTRIKFRWILLTIIPCCILVGCSDDDDLTDKDFKQEMRNFVQGISSYAKGLSPGFNIIPQNGQELVTGNGEEDGTCDMTYLNAIDGIGREDLFYGFDNDDVATIDDDRNYIISFLDKAYGFGKVILVTDYCSTLSKMDDSYSQNELKNYIAFAADQRDLDNIPSYPSEPNNTNTKVISSLDEAENFLYILDPEPFTTKQKFIDQVTATDYDLLIMDIFFDNVEFTSSEITELKNKSNGGKRLVISYMSIGEAEDYRYYWNSGWLSDSPTWLKEENPNWEGNYKVQYWDTEWQEIIYGNSESYLKKIIDAGFDGVYLDIIDAFEYFEDMK